jgi:hypothetical protein
VTTRPVARSMFQFAARQRYDGYIGSDAWLRRRRRWLAIERRAHGGRIYCAICGCVWGTKTSGGELHHLTYDRLGDERHEDLVALCAADHRAVERLFVLGAYRGVPRELAMRSVVAALRAKAVGR